MIQNFWYKVHEKNIPKSTKKMMPHHPSITVTNCYLMALPKGAVFVKNVVQEEKVTIFWDLAKWKTSGLKSFRGY